MNAIKKILIMLLFLCCSMTIFCYIGFRLGYDGLILIGEVGLPYWFVYLLSCLLFGLQFTMQLGFSLGEYTKKSIYMALPYILFASVGCLLVPNIFITLVFPLIYIIGFAIYRKDLRTTFLRWLFITGLVAVYQSISLAIKTFDFNYINGSDSLTQYEWLMWSIDMMLFVLIIYAIGGEKYYARTWKYRFCSEDIELAEHDFDDRKSIEQFQKLNGFKKLVAMSLLIGFQILQWAIILIVCYYDNIFLEGLTITTSFIANGFIVKRRWHSNSLIICTLTSVAMFYISAKITISFAYSQLFSIFIGAVLIYGLYKISTSMDKEEIENSEASIQRLTDIERKMIDAWSTIDKISNTL